MMLVNKYDVNVLSIRQNLQNEFRRRQLNHLIHLTPTENQ